jgi:hypothetical protein
MSSFATGESPSEVHTGFPWKRIVQALISLAIVVGIFAGVMPLIADYGDVFETIRAMTGLEVGSLVLIGLWNLVTYWFVLTAALPGLRLREAAVVNQASTAVSNTMPGGGVIGVGVSIAMLTSWGFRIGSIGRSAVVTGIWNNFVKLGMPVFALALLALEGEITPARLMAAGIGIAVLVGAVVVFALLLRSDRLARGIGRGVGRLVDWVRRLLRKEPVGGWEERASTFRADTIGLLRHRWAWLTIATLVSHISLYLVLLVALRHVAANTRRCRSRRTRVRSSHDDRARRHHQCPGRGGDSRVQGGYLPPADSPRSDLLRHLASESELEDDRGRPHEADR